MQELDGTLPSQPSSLGVILGAILLEEPMAGPRIGIEGGLLPGGLERLLHLGDRLRRLERVLLRKVAEVGSRSFAIAQAGIGGIKADDGGDVIGQRKGRVKRIGATQREADEGDLAATASQVGRSVLAQDPSCCRDVAAPPLHML